MISRAEIAAGLTGAWQLARRQPQGLDFFDRTPRGFFRSFWAAALALPAALALDVFDGVFSGPAGLLLPLVVQVIAAVIDAVAFPLAMATVTRELGRAERYVTFVVAYNWSSLLRMMAFFAVALLTHVAPQAHVLLLAVLVLLLIYEAYVVHVALDVPPPVAAAVVLLDVLIDALVGMSAHGLMG